MFDPQSWGKKKGMMGEVQTAIGTYTNKSTEPKVEG
jgi:hypothetical protein